MKPTTKTAPDSSSSALFSTSSQACDINESLTTPVDCTRILLVDDHPVVRKGILSCLSIRDNLLVVGEAADGREAVRKVDELRPDLVLMDVEMPHMNGLEATGAICKVFPGIKVLVLSMHDKLDYVVQAIQSGARGFAPKNLPAEDLIKAIEIVQRGEPYFPGQAALAGRTKREVTKDASGLFEREKEVLIHLATGYGNREIAEMLNLSIRTVESHRARLMKKLNIHTIAGLTRYALMHGFISLGPFLTIPPSPLEPLPFSLNQERPARS